MTVALLYCQSGNRCRRDRKGEAGGKARRDAEETRCRRGEYQLSTTTSFSESSPGSQAKVAEHQNVTSTEEEERTKILAEIEDFNQSIVELDQNYKDGQKKIRDTDVSRYQAIRITVAGK